MTRPEDSFRAALEIVVARKIADPDADVIELFAQAVAAIASLAVATGGLDVAVDLVLKPSAEATQ